MKRTILHISSALKNPQAYKNQPDNLFPFLDSPIMDQTAKKQIRFKSIYASANLRNIKQVVPHKDLCHEFIFFGRSNVGKSTLLNHLIQRPVALVSKRPGKTKQFLFCELQSKKKAYLIDAPGYGFATGVSKKEIDQWGKLVETYLKLTDKNNFKQKILCLMDITHGIKEVDAILFRMLDDFKKQFMIVFTKCDKMDNNDLVKGIEIAQMLRQKYNNLNYYVHFTSSLSLQGVDELRNHLMFEIVSEDI